MFVPFDPALENLLREIGATAAELGAHAWAVGGIVRDAFLSHPNKDVDITVVGDAPALVRRLCAEWGATLEQHDAFTTATLARPDGYEVDIVRARSEVYKKPGALPTVKPSGLEDDLCRRDFTVNAMAASLAPDSYGELVDPLEGLTDLRAGVLRTLHAGSFLDDPTRLFRAARYAVRYGLSPEPMTDGTAHEAVTEGALRTVSADRRRREVELICEERRWAEMLEWLNRWGVWKWLSEGWEPQTLMLRRIDVARVWAARHLPDPLPLAWFLRFLMLLCEAPDVLQGRLSVKPAEAARVERARRVTQSLIGPLRPEWYRAMDVEKVSTLLLALCLSRTDAEKRRICDYLVRVRSMMLSITGTDLVVAGVEPGPEIGAALRDTLDALRVGGVSGREEELSYALSRLGRG